MPVSRYLYYYVIPKKAKFQPIDVVTDTIKRKKNKNIQCGMYGIRTQSDLDDFIEIQLRQNFEVRLASVSVDL